jgi:hypothetical protein
MLVVADITANWYVMQCSVPESYQRLIEPSVSIVQAETAENEPSRLLPTPACFVKINATHSRRCCYIDYI